MNLLVSKRASRENKVIENLLAAHGKMASAEVVDAKGLVMLSRYLWKLIHQLPDEQVDVIPPDEGNRD